MPTIMLQKARQREERQILSLQSITSNQSQEPESAPKGPHKIIDSIKNFLESDSALISFRKFGVPYNSQKLIKDFHKFLKESKISQ
jgi:hypothetical protein